MAKAEERSDFEEMMDEIGPPDSDEEDGVTAVQPADPAPATDPPPTETASAPKAPETPPEPAVDPPAPTEPKATDPPVSVPAEPAVADSSTGNAPPAVPTEAVPATPAPTTSEQHKAGMLTELARLRIENKKLRQQDHAQAAAPVAPAQPAAAETTPAAEELLGFKFNEEGGGVPISEINDLIDRRMAPSPQQIRQQKQLATRNDFVSADPARNGPIFDRAAMGIDWIQVKGEAMARQHGLDTDRMDVAGFMRFANDSGLMAEFNTLFPEMTQDIGVLVGAGATGDAYVMQEALTRYGNSVRFMEQAGAPAVPAVPGAAPAAVPALPGGPPSLSGVGTSTPAPAEGAAGRLAVLRDKERRDPTMSDALAAELEALERKVG